MNLPADYLKSILFESQRYKSLGDKTFIQLNESDIHWKYESSGNSIAVVVKHLSGNMLSRWTNFLTEDGEKIWRNRDSEFEASYKTKKEMLTAWETGWNCFFKAIQQVNSENFENKIKIRNEPHTLIEALNRQLAHYSYHVGQIVLIGKTIKGKSWVSLSIPKGQSEAYNKSKFKG
ncbi:DUF1572 family protein [uncultured Eudoraea sp.]|uniref:DUF1572 family protein n=1 Tax=uncultured Eudoraea sp. TaxID=1035614 RepID=UPI00261BC191|nr:DUF1572 family protein [uncultured Eudoraea sp.]